MSEVQLCRRCGRVFAWHGGNPMVVAGLFAWHRLVACHQSLRGGR
jgi:hypothetical protein